MDVAAQRALTQDLVEIQRALRAVVFVQALTEQFAQFAAVRVADAGAVGVVQLEVRAPPQQLAAMGDEGCDADAAGHQDVPARLAVQGEQVGWGT